MPPRPDPETALDARTAATARSSVRLLWSALLMDTAFFAALACLPFDFKREGVLFLQDDALGLALALLGVAYVVGALALALPRVLRGRDPIWTTRIAGAVTGGLFAAASLTDALGLALAILFVGRLALGAYWPPLMAMVGVGASSSLGARIARFNSWWGTGKACAFLVCGALLEVLGGPRLALRCAGFAMIASVCLVGGGSARRAAAELREKARARSEARRAGNRDARSSAHEPDRSFELALVALLCGALVGAIWESQYPKGLGQARYAELFGARFDLGINALLFCLYAGQAATFFALRAFPRWPRVRWLARAALAVLVAGQGVALFFEAWWATAAGLFVSGAAFGVFYSRCLFVAQAGREDAARRGGIHESVLSTGSVLGPPLGGVLAVASGDLRAPFVAALALSALAALYVYARGARLTTRRRPSSPGS